jgi:hypothetical protein
VVRDLAERIIAFPVARAPQEDRLRSGGTAGHRWGVGRLHVQRHAERGADRVAGARLHDDEGPLERRLAERARVVEFDDECRQAHELRVEIGAVPALEFEARTMEGDAGRFARIAAVGPEGAELDGFPRARSRGLAPVHEQAVVQRAEIEIVEPGADLELDVVALHSTAPRSARAVSA